MKSQKVEFSVFRHSGESRKPEFSACGNYLDPGLRRGDDFFQVPHALQKFSRCGGQLAPLAFE